MRAWGAGRLAAAAGLWLVVTVAAYLLGNQPRPGLIALMIAAGATVLWLLLDVSGDSETVRWSSPRAVPVRLPGEDPRLALLHRVVVQHLDSRDVGNALHRHLAELADQRLVAHHGVSRRADPDRADAILGPELARVVADASGGPPYPRLSLDQIDLIVSRIEDL
ncbi:hypothetical protein [Nocardioides mesophilus]|uniref:Uncharacterized protein n=1 Tax=Nocardioides mesophilus TaxID=433659 RepID=A0A7G9R841_9ACTN|nr:hypothetical protein [Nocardioides mesophilus]QNN51766.1 hypothetical protein H9L09_14570 [Nocardioides mesophilus]